MESQEMTAMNRMAQQRAVEEFRIAWSQFTAWGQWESGGIVGLTDCIDEMLGEASAGELPRERLYAMEEATRSMYSVMHCVTAMMGPRG